MSGMAGCGSGAAWLAPAARHWRSRAAYRSSARASCRPEAYRAPASPDPASAHRHCSRLRRLLGCILRRRPGLSKGGEGKQRAGEQDRGEEFVRHEGPFEYVHDSKTGIGICLRACVMSDRPFSPLSCVGSLPPRRLSLGICRGALRQARLPKIAIIGTTHRTRAREIAVLCVHKWTDSPADICSIGALPLLNLTCDPPGLEPGFSSVSPRSP